MVNKVATYHTPVENLFLGGHWAELGGGVPIAAKAGTNAVLLILKKENPKAYKVLADYFDGKAGLDTVLACTEFSPYNGTWEPKPTPAQKKKLRQQQGDLQYSPDDEE